MGAGRPEGTRGDLRLVGRGRIAQCFVDCISLFVVRVHVRGRNARRTLHSTDKHCPREPDDRPQSVVVDTQRGGVGPYTVHNLESTQECTQGEPVGHRAGQARLDPGRFVRNRGECCAGEGKEPGKELSRVMTVKVHVQDLERVRGRDGEADEWDLGMVVLVELARCRSKVGEVRALGREDERVGRVEDPGLRACARVVDDEKVGGQMALFVAIWRSIAFHRARERALGYYFGDEGPRRCADAVLS